MIKCQIMKGILGDCSPLHRAEFLVRPCIDDILSNLPYGTLNKYYKVDLVLLTHSEDIIDVYVHEIKEETL